MNSNRNKKNNVILFYINSVVENKKRLNKELIIPIVLTILASIMYILFSQESILERVTNLNSLTITVVAIQIGFLITSLALIASFGAKAGELAFSSKTNKEQIYDFMKEIINSFVYNIIIYMILLGLSFLHIGLIAPICNNISEEINISLRYINLIKVSYFSMFIFLILHGNLMFLRNIYLIRLYLLSIFKSSK